MRSQNNQKLRYFLYARKSSEAEDRQVQSVEDQIKDLQGVASRYNLNIIETVEEERSGKKPNDRPLFNNMMDRIEAGEADGILVWHINRLSRNPVDSGRISWMLQQNVIKSIQTMSREYLPDDNVLLLSVESGMANQFIIDLKKSSKRGMDSKAEKGYMPSNAPIGYINDIANRIIIKDPERFDLVRKMWDMMLTGNYNPVQIMKIANDEWGFRTLKRRKSGGGPLVNSVIYRMFTNIFYTGSFSWNGNIYTNGKHPAMITNDEYDRVQVILGKKGKPRKQTHDFAYTGIIRCGECGCMYTAIEKTKLIKSTGELKTYIYYHCSKRKPDIKCTSGNLTLEELESRIGFELERNTIHPKFQEWALEILRKNNDKEVTERTAIYENQQRSANEVQKELDNLTKMRLRDLIDDDEFVKTKEELKDKLLKLRDNIRNTENRADTWQELTEKTFYFSRYAHERFVTGDLQTKREIFSALGQNFTITNKKLFINKNEWFIPIQNAYPELKSRFDALELDNTLTEYERNRQINLLISDWCGYRDLNPV